MLSFFLSDQKYYTDPISDFFYNVVGGGEASSGVTVSNETAMTYSAVWACTRILSASGSVLPLNLFRKDGTQRVVAEGHPVHELIRNMPNGEMSSMSFRTVGINKQVNCGNFYAEIQRDIAGNPRALWPIVDRVEVMRADADMASKLGIEVNGLCWRVRGSSGVPTYIADRNMFHVSSTITDNGIVGKGVIENARESIGLGIATERQGAAYMKNSARPAVVIKGGKFKTAEDRAFFRESWMETHGGATNNAKPAMLPDGADISVLGFSPEDSQFLGTRQHNVEEICRWYGVPPHMVQHLLRATFNNIEHQGIEFVVYSLVPWLKMWEDEIYRKLLTPVERRTMYAKHNVDALLRGDTKARAEFYKTLWELGVVSTNEIREKEDWNPIGDVGDQRYVQTSYTTTDNLGVTEWRSAREKNDVTRDEFRERVLNLPPSEETNDSPLLSLASGLTGAAEVSAAVGRGDISADAGAELLELFLRVEASRAAKIAGEKMPQPEQPATTQQSAPNDNNDMNDGDLSKREAAVREAAKIMVEETARLMLSRESIALGRAASKKPKEFFQWVNEFYDEHQLIMATSFHRPLLAYFTACGSDADAGKASTELAASNVSESRNAVLEATAIQPDQWSTLSVSIKSLTDAWQVDRVAKQVETICKGV